MTEDQIRHMVERFLNWSLPYNFSPDGGISFKQSTVEGGYKFMPTGTNLFNYPQALAMVKHMVEDLPASQPETPDNQGALETIMDIMRKAAKIGKYDLALECAKAAAPYVHMGLPRQEDVTIDGDLYVTGDIKARYKK